MRLHWVRDGPNAMTGVLRRGGNRDTERQTSGGEGDGQVGKGWRDVSVCDHCQQHQKLGERMQQSLPQNARELPLSTPRYELLTS